jgi:hypothetical protein
MDSGFNDKIFLFEKQSDNIMVYEAFKVTLLILANMTIVQKSAFVGFLGIMIFDGNMQFRMT